VPDVLYLLLEHLTNNPIKIPVAPRAGKNEDAKPHQLVRLELSNHQS